MMGGADVWWIRLFSFLSYVIVKAAGDPGGFLMSAENVRKMWRQL